MLPSKAIQLFGGKQSDCVTGVTVGWDLAACASGNMLDPHSACLNRALVSHHQGCFGLGVGVSVTLSPFAVALWLRAAVSKGAGLLARGDCCGALCGSNSILGIREGLGEGLCVGVGEGAAQLFPGK